MTVITAKETKSMRATDGAPELTGMYSQRLFVFARYQRFTGTDAITCFLFLRHLIYRLRQFFQLCRCNNVWRHNINQPSERADPHTGVNKAAL